MPSWPGPRSAMTLAGFAACLGRNLDPAPASCPGLDCRDGAQSVEEAAHSLPRAAVEQVVMAGLRHDRHRLRRARRMEHAPRKIERDDCVAPAMNDEERRLDRADPLDGAILVGHDQAERESLPHQSSDIDDRGEGRFEHERLDMTLE